LELKLLSFILLQGRPRASAEQAGPSRDGAQPSTADADEETQQQQQQPNSRVRRQATQPQWLAESHQDARQLQSQPGARAAASQPQQEQQEQEEQQGQQQQRQSRPLAEQDAARRIRDLVKSDRFWLQLQQFTDVCHPFVSLMRLADSNVPCMGKLYHHFYMLSRFAEAVAGDADAIADIEEMYRAQVLGIFAFSWTAKKCCSLFPLLLNCGLHSFLLFHHAQGLYCLLRPTFWVPKSCCSSFHADGGSWHSGPHR